MNMKMNQHFYIVSGEYKGKRGIYKGIHYRSGKSSQFNFLVDSEEIVSVPCGYFKAV